ncbi:MAG: hypothetical protein GX335_07370 [Firmicutes bacterium]|nr:hypothetical protein [Bacillota bacterium]
MDEEQVKLAEQTEGGPETEPRFRPLPYDYPAVIRQIKREILIEISGYSQNGVLPAQNRVHDVYKQSKRLDLLEDVEIEKLLSQIMWEARRRGLLQPNHRNGSGLTQTLLTLLFFPQARLRLLRILEQSALSGLKLVEQANSLFEQTKGSILSTLMDELY